MLAAIVLIILRADGELYAVDFVLSEFHLGSTYDAILRRRLWHHRQFDVLLIPLVILALTYALSLGGQTILLTSIAMYAAVWHRGRQSLGVARFYQRGMGGPVSRPHEVLFRGAIYLPMLAAALAYAQLAPGEYQGEPYVALSVGAEITWAVGLGAVLWVIAYFVWTLRERRADRVTLMPGKTEIGIHPGEWWVVLCHQFRRSSDRRLVSTPMACAAGHGRAFLSLLARWAHLDATIISKLTEEKKMQCKVFSRANFDYRRTERLRQHRTQHRSARSV